VPSYPFAFWRGRGEKEVIGDRRRGEGLRQPVAARGKIEGKGGRKGKKTRGERQDRLYLPRRPGKSLWREEGGG